jgi:S1-C subfamily serine protease
MKFSEVVTITVVAATVALGGRAFLNLAPGNNPIKHAVEQARHLELLRSIPIPQAFKSDTPLNLPAGTPDAIVEANKSVVMLRANHAVGSGIILSSDGLVLTNRHVVRGGGTGRWTIQLADNRQFSARVVNAGAPGDQMPQDLALVQMEGASNLPVAKLADTTPQAGDAVWAIGAPYAHAEVVTKGAFTTLTPDGIVLSNTEIHPGNSGGPLLNQKGEVVGINTGYSPDVPADQSTASISVDMVKESLQAMSSGGSDYQAEQPFRSRPNFPPTAENYPRSPYAPRVPARRYPPGYPRPDYSPYYPPGEFPPDTMPNGSRPDYSDVYGTQSSSGI